LTILIYALKIILSSLSEDNAMIQERLTVSDRGYIVLPLRIRKEMKIKPGTKILLSKEDNRIILQPVSSFTEKLSGLTAGSFGKNKDQVDKFLNKEREDR